MKSNEVKEKKPALQARNTAETVKLAEKKLEECLGSALNALRAASVTLASVVAMQSALMEKVAEAEKKHRVMRLSPAELN